MSGYAVDSLLPERGFDVAGLLTGAEGTLAVVTEATVDLVREPRHRLLVVLGYPDIGTAGDAVPALLEHRPTACEGMDARIVDVLRDRRGPAAVPPLPAGASLAFRRDRRRRRRFRAGPGGTRRRRRHALDSTVVTDLAHAAALWRIREDGAGLAARAPSGRPAHAGWEDAAVPPARIGENLRACDDLVAAHGLTSMPDGRLGDGCVHVRLDFPLDRPGGAARFRAFLTDAADLVVGFGGSLSGEHGDGRARSELLPRMYSPAALAMFRSVKHAFDPEGLLNPGVLVDPAPVDAAIRVVAARPVRQPLALAWSRDGGDFTQAVHRCTGVGKCLAAPAASGGGVMCPLLPGHQGREGHHQGTRAGAAGDDRRRPRRRLALAGRARRAGPVPVVQGVRVGLPDRHRHGRLQGRGAAPGLPPPDPAAHALHTGLAAALVAVGGPDTATGQPAHRRGRRAPADAVRRGGRHPSVDSGVRTGDVPALVQSHCR